MSLIVVDQNPDQDFRFESEKGGREWTKAEGSDARRFFVEIAESQKVVLRAIDDKPAGMIANNVIFSVGRTKISRSSRVHSLSNTRGSRN